MDYSADALYGYTQILEAVRALDAAWPSLPPGESERAERLLAEAVELLAAAEADLFPRLGLTPPDRTPRTPGKPPERPLP